jgi:Lrp/AsnC family leucine-responsive transcriptional regulator
MLDMVRVTGKGCFVVRWAFAASVDLERAVDAQAAHGSVITKLALSHSLHRLPLVQR